QFTNYDHTNILSWQQLSYTIDKNLRGRKLKWFNSITTKIKEILSEKRITLTTPNPFILKQPT
ncbi:4329_t:CDS:1, partial [Scutellospora calospora]